MSAPETGYPGIGRRQLLIGGAAIVLAAPRMAAAKAAAARDTIQVFMKGIVFSPEVVEARVGQVIEWINNDSFEHTATADGKWNYMIPVGKKIRHVVKKADAGAYYCRLHPNMTGEIKVIS